MLRRVARPLFFIGCVVIVFGLGRIHSSRESYDLTNSFRFAWEITYAALLLVAAYGAGLPDLVRTRRQAVASAQKFSTLSRRAAKPISSRWAVPLRRSTLPWVCG